MLKFILIWASNTMFETMFKLIKAMFWLLGLMILITCWPLAIIIGIFLGLMKVGMKKDFEP